MQEQNESKVPSFAARLGARNIICLSVFGILMLAAALAWLLPHAALRTATWREADNTLPWKSGSLVVKSLKGHWESSAGNERMMLRTAFYPVADIELGEAEGSGMLYINFTDSNGRQAGDTISLYYNKGAFNPRDEQNIKAEGNKARVHIETGYDREDEFRLHQLDESSDLWRISLHFRPEGAYDMQPMGYITIPAELGQ